MRTFAVRRKRVCAVRDDDGPPSRRPLRSEAASIWGTTTPQALRASSPYTGEPAGERVKVVGPYEIGATSSGFNSLYTRGAKIMKEK